MEQSVDDKECPLFFVFSTDAKEAGILSVVGLKITDFQSGQFADPETERP